MPEVSVVIPVYGCRDCLQPLYERLSASVGSITHSYELIFVDDRSRDGAWAELRRLASSDARVQALRLSRNFGQHRAITAGLAEATGEWVVVADCDLEDPPEEIPRLFGKLAEGYDFVLSRRVRRHQSILRRIAARVYRSLANTLAGTDVDPDYVNFSVISRKIVDEYLRFRDQDRQYLLILLWLGFHHATIDFDRAQRYAGSSSYSFGQLIRVAVDGIFFQTTKLLRWIVYVGFAVATAGVLLLALIAYNYVLRQPPAGWTSLSVLVLILGGFIIVAVGVTGLYVAKIFGQVKGRPLFVIDERIGTRQEVKAASDQSPAEADQLSDPSLSRTS